MPRWPLPLTLTLLLLSLPVTASTEQEQFTGTLSERSLLKEIGAAQQQSWTYLQQARAIDGVDGTPQATPMGRERKEHCLILGRLLGMERVIGPFRLPPPPDGEGSRKAQAAGLRAAAASFASFAVAGSRIAGMKRAERALEWNLDCADYAASRRLVDAAPTTAFFRHDDNGRVLRVLGDITPGFANRLRQALAASPNVQVVALGSPGGTVDEAIDAGRMIRQRGLRTVLWNDCYSACPLVFAGGVQRHIRSPAKALGVHQMYGEHGAAPRTFAEYREIQRYLRAMGVDAEAVIKLMWMAPPEGMHEIDLTGDEACKTGLATWVEGVCDARARRR